MSERIGVSDNDPNGGLAMVLASAAYCDGPGATLQKYAPGWSVPWKADAAIKGNLAYIAYNGVDQYVVAIRGSILRFSVGTLWNWFEQDFNVLSQTDWQYPSSASNAKISQGSADGLQHLSELVQTRNGTRQTILEFLLQNAIGTGASIGVVGHSLGGNLATVLAPWLTYQIRQASHPLPSLFPVLTFAAPTAGNKAFAQAYDAAFPHSWRYFNKSDVVPRASADISSIADLFQPEPQASQIRSTITIRGRQYDVTLAEAWWIIAGIVDVSEFAYGSYYSQTNLTRGSVELDTAGAGCPLPIGAPTATQWFEVTECQHSHLTYLRNLGKGDLDFCCVKTG